MRDQHEEFTQRGAELVAIGMGTPEMAAHFRDESGIPFRLIVDRTKETYRAVDLARGNLWNILGPPVWIPGLRNLIAGYRQRLARQDPLQLGASMVVAPGGEIKFAQRARASSEPIPVGTLLETLDDLSDRSGGVPA